MSKIKTVKQTEAKFPFHQQKNLQRPATAKLKLLPLAVFMFKVVSKAHNFSTMFFVSHSSMPGQQDPLVLYETELLVSI